MNSSTMPRVIGGAGLTDLLARIRQTINPAPAPPPQCAECNDTRVVAVSQTPTGEALYERCLCTRSRLRLVESSVAPSVTPLERARRELQSEYGGK